MSCAHLPYTCSKGWVKYILNVVTYMSPSAVEKKKKMKGR